MIAAALLILASQPLSARSDAEVCADVTGQIATFNEMVAEMETEAGRIERSEPSKVDCVKKIIRFNAQSDMTGAEARAFVQQVEADPESECAGFRSLIPLLGPGWRFEGFTRFANGTTFEQDLLCETKM